MIHFEPFFNDYFTNAAVEIVGHNELQNRLWFEHGTSTPTEIAQAIRNDLVLPAVVIDYPVADADFGDRNLRWKISSSLSVLMEIEQGNPQSLRTIRYECAQLARRFVARMYRDSRLSPMGVKGILLQECITLTTLMTGGLVDIIEGKYAGYYYSFGWLLPADFEEM